MDRFQYISSFFGLHVKRLYRPFKSRYLYGQTTAFCVKQCRKTPLGCIDLYDFDPQHHRAGIGLVIDKAHRQKAMLCTIALELIEAVAFDQLQLHQLYAGVGEDNPASIRLFQSAGYQQCGLKKDWNFYRNAYHDELIFQKIADV